MQFIGILDCNHYLSECLLPKRMNDCTSNWGSETVDFYFIIADSADEINRRTNNNRCLFNLMYHGWMYPATPSTLNNPMGIFTEKTNNGISAKSTLDGFVAINETYNDVVYTHAGGPRGLKLMSPDNAKFFVDSSLPICDFFTLCECGKNHRKLICYYWLVYENPDFFRNNFTSFQTLSQVFDFLKLHSPLPMKDNIESVESIAKLL